MIKQSPAPQVVAQHVAELRSLNDRLIVAQKGGKLEEASVVMAQLRSAVDEARAVEVGWAAIGAALYVARGNAYQRFRKPPSHAEVAEIVAETSPPQSRRGIRYRGRDGWPKFRSEDRLSRSLAPRSPLSGRFDGVKLLEELACLNQRGDQLLPFRSGALVFAADMQPPLHLTAVVLLACDTHPDAPHCPLPDDEVAAPVVAVPAPGTAVDGIGGQRHVRESVGQSLFVITQLVTRRNEMDVAGKIHS